MKQLKLKRDFWNAFKDGSKKYQFRKLEKGIITGTYEFRELKVLLPKGQCIDEKAHQGKIHYIDVDDEYISPEDKGYMDYLIENNYSVDTDWSIATKWHREIAYCRKCSWQNDEYELFGTAHLKPLAINPKIIINPIHKIPEMNILGYLEEDNEYYGLPLFFDKETYDFVKENYIDKGIDFVVYEVSDVKGAE